ncbi:hypothetical protein [Nitrosomonas sp.]|uniref:hypothetical protein n=1 Tax=Nitrosomonas sp. TaxID=42353 RepID=UPI0025F10D87|nr:hypothetical protein [Nitrosomonas sp.]MBY0485550.1 hypothetical protein [Nitrosomonas sp.]
MKQFNLLAILAACLVFSSPILAAADQDKDLKAEKDRRIGNIKEWMDLSQERLSCVQNAKDFEALKSCNQAADKKSDALEAKIKAQHSDQRAGPEKNHSQTKPNHPDNKTQNN